MVGLHLRVVTIHRGLIWRGHDPSIVAETVDLVILGLDLPARLVDCREVLQITFDGHELPVGHGFFQALQGSFHTTGLAVQK